MKKLVTMLFTMTMLFAIASSAFAAEEKDPAVQEETVQIDAKLSKEEVLDAALKDAGETQANVSVTKNKLSEKKTENGETIVVYTIKFNTETTTYKYFVDADTGEILYKKIEFQNSKTVFKSRDDEEKNSNENKEKNDKNNKSKKNEKNTEDITEDGSHGDNTSESKEKSSKNKKGSAASDDPNTQEGPAVSEDAADLTDSASSTDSVSSTDAKSPADAASPTDTASPADTALPEDTETPADEAA